MLHISIYNYTPGIHAHTHTHTHTHNLANCNTIYTITHRNIHKQTLGIYTYTHDKYTTSCRYTYTRNIYTYALSIDNYTPGNYKYRLGTYNMIIYTTAYAHAHLTCTSTYTDYTHTQPVHGVCINTFCIYILRIYTNTK